MYTAVPIDENADEKKEEKEEVGLKKAVLPKFQRPGCPTPIGALVSSDKVVSYQCYGICAMSMKWKCV